MSGVCVNMGLKNRPPGIDWRKNSSPSQGQPRRAAHHEGAFIMWTTILWIAAVIIGIFGVIRIVRGDLVVGIVLIVVALLVGPGGVSIFS